MTTAEKNRSISADAALTTAEKVAERLYDGQTFETDDGVTLEELCDEHGASVEYGRTEWSEDGDERITRQVSRSDHFSDDPIRYVFEDGSAVVVAGAAWDVEGAKPFSWRGA